MHGASCVRPGGSCESQKGRGATGNDSPRRGGHAGRAAGVTSPARPQGSRPRGSVRGEIPTCSQRPQDFVASFVVVFSLDQSPLPARSMCRVVRSPSDVTAYPAVRRGLSHVIHQNIAHKILQWARPPLGTACTAIGAVRVLGEMYSGVWAVHFIPVDISSAWTLRCRHAFNASSA